MIHFSPVSPRPLYRWKSFWLGIFVLLFLTWSWWRSLDLAEKIVFGEPDRGSFVEVGQCAGICFFNISYRPDDTALKGYSLFLRWGPTAGIWENPIETPDHRFPPSISAVSEKGAGLGIAHWFLILISSLPWLIVLKRRQRLIHRLEQQQQ